MRKIAYKYSIDDMKKVARARGGKCLSTVYVNYSSKIKWECIKGHHWEATPNNIFKGTWCPACKGVRKLTILEMHELAKERGGKCLSTQYVNNRTKITWECSEGHVWQSIPADVKKGTWCPTCNHARKLTIEEMRQIAHERGGSCLSKRYVNNMTKLEWRCSKGHEWMARPSDVKRGHWCPFCANSGKKTIKDMQELAAQKGGKVISKNYINGKTKLTWECKDGHEWKSTPNNIASGRWCPVCGGQKHFSLEEIQDLAKERKGRCISEKIIANKNKLQFECERGHEFWARPYDVKKGLWCPRCSGRIKSTLEGMKELALERNGRCLSKIYVNNKTKLRWLCNKGHVWHADPEHVKGGSWCPYCSGNKKLTIIEMKIIAFMHGGSCLSSELEKSAIPLTFRCKNEHEFKMLPGRVRKGYWCNSCLRENRSLLEEMHAMAKIRGGICLSKGKVNFVKGFLFRCEEDHEWYATHESIRNKEWCPICTKINRWTIKDMKKIARMRGGSCLSKRYSSNTKLKWICELGHEWKATSHNVLEGTWCPTCGGTSKSNIAEMKALAHMRSGECLSNAYIDNSTKLLWRCKKGHEWYTSPNTIVTGHWCPICARCVKGTIDEMHELAKKRNGKCLSSNYINSSSKLRWKCKEGHEWMATPATIKRGSWCPACSTKRKKIYYTIEDMQELAEQKNGACLSQKYINGNTKLSWRCENGHEWKTTPNNVRKGSWCPTCVKRKKGTIQDMQELAAQKGGECISEHYINTDTHLTWRCAKGHEWKAIPDSIKRGSWCPACSGRKKLTIEEMKILAASKNGKCLSIKYINSQTKLRWQCEKGHEWDAVPSSIKRGSWCPTCAKKPKPTKYTIEDMQELARLKGGKCLSTVYASIEKKLRWQCAHGHEWEAVPVSIQKRGTWCPTCYSLRRRKKI